MANLAPASGTGGQQAGEPNRVFSANEQEAGREAWGGQIGNLAPMSGTADGEQARSRKNSKHHNADGKRNFKTEEKKKQQELRHRPSADGNISGQMMIIT